MGKRRRPLSTGVISLIKRGLRVGMDLEKISRAINMKYESLLACIEEDQKLKDMVESIPMMGALELHEAMHANAVVNMDGSVQKFLAKNLLGMKDKVEVENTEVKIVVNFNEEAKTLIDGEAHDVEDAQLIEDMGDEFQQSVQFLKKAKV